MDNWTWRGQTHPVAARETSQGGQGEMHADEIRLAAESGAWTLEEHLAALRNERPRVFWLGFTLALMVHALLIIGIGRSSNRTLGKEDGAADAIAVEIVDAATLKDSMAPPAPPAAAPPAQQPQQQQQPPQQAQPEVPPTPPTPPEVAEAQPPPPPPPEAAPPKETPPDTKSPQALPEDFADTLAELQDTPADQQKPQKTPEQPKEAPKQEVTPAEKQPPPKQAEQKQQQQAKPKPKPPQKRTQTSALDLSVPSDDGTDGDDAGTSSAVQRPPGITRSGENDEFARNVIRALQKTMPRERANGRVTVRIVLSENGSRADVKLLKSGGDPDLDFNVMFAARQTAYPFPPDKSTLVDRTFTVTYIYR
jgi:periplasmic protein TonB